MNSYQENLVNVIQGQYICSIDPKTVLTTVLGSCIACCLYDPISEVGGMNHFLLADGAATSKDFTKYGIHAMEILINELLKSGAKRNNFQAKLFGGAAVSNNSSNIGMSNSKFAKDFLEAEGIVCISSSLGGNNARRIRFKPTTGEAQQKIIASECNFTQNQTSTLFKPNEPEMF